MSRNPNKIEEIVNSLRRELAIKAMAMKKATDSYEEITKNKRVSATSARVALEDLQKIQGQINPAIDFILESYKFAKEASEAHQRFLDGIKDIKPLGRPRKVVEAQEVIK